MSINIKFEKFVVKDKFKKERPKTLFIYSCASLLYGSSRSFTL